MENSEAYSVRFLQSDQWDSALITHSSNHQHNSRPFGGLYQLPLFHSSWSPQSTYLGPHSCTQAFMSEALLSGGTRLKQQVHIVSQGARQEPKWQYACFNLSSVIFVGPPPFLSHPDLLPKTEVPVGMTSNFISSSNLSRTILRKAEMNFQTRAQSRPCTQNITDQKVHGEYLRTCTWCSQELHI